MPTIVAGNLGPSPAVGVTVTDTLPSGLVLTGAATATAGGGFALTTNSCTSSGTPVTVTCTLGTLPVAANAGDVAKLVTITIPVKAPYPAYTTPFLSDRTNTATIAPLPNTSRDPTPGNNSNSVNVQIVKSSIAGSVYSDNNRNDALDGGEKITASVTFGLYGVDNWGNNIGTLGAPISLSTSTGDFLFNNLPQSDGAGYTVVETQPAGYYDRFEIAGTSAGTAPVATCDGAANCSSSAAHNTIGAINLAANTAATGYLFQEYKAATVSGYVYSDLNNDGLRVGGGEVGIAGIQVKIAGTTYWTGGDVCTFLAGACTATTNGSGFYTFSMPPSAVGNNYTVAEQTLPATYYDGKDQNGAGAGNVIGGSAGRAAPESITVGQVDPNVSYTERNFGELKEASIAGSVFIDANSDAVKQGGEVGGVPGVTITLAGLDHLGNAVCPSATVPSCTFATDGSGNYAITGLPPSGAGGYSVTETPPAGMTHTGTQAGSIGGTISGVVRAAAVGVTGVGVVSTSAIVLGAGVTATGYNFGEAGQGIQGFVYADLNRNGTKDAGEPGILNVTVTLSGTTISAANVCAAIAPNPCSVLTAANGGYSFAGLPQSNGAGYTLTESQPAGYPDGAESLGAVVGAGGANGSISGPNPTYDQFSGIVLPIGGVGTNYNFGEWAGSLAGTVYLDVDNSGTNNGGDTFIANVTITLGGGAAATTTTDASGNFTFTGLAAGTYTLTESQPVNYADRTNAAGSAGGTVGVNTITNIVLGGGVSATGYLFGEKTGALSGTVYVDSNNNGVQDGGETTGIGSVLLTLTGTAIDGVTAVNSTTSTLANGSYSFTGLPNANAAGYTLTETQPAYLDGLQRKGQINGASTCANPNCVITLANKISAIPFDASKSFTLFDFGELVAGSVAGSVYHDVNNNSVKDAGEALVGVTLTLTGSDDLGAAVNLNTTTAADGTYSFSGLRPSNGAGYTVTQTQPAGISNYPAATGTQVGTISAVATGATGAGADVISAIILPSAGAGLNYNFRETASSLAGTVYVDANSDGVPQADEVKLSGVTVTLSGTTTAAANVCTVIPSCVTATAADGTYSFVGLPSGTYTLTETQPSTHSDGMEGAGSPAGSVNNANFDATAASNQVANIALAAGQNGSGYNFGEILISVAWSSLAGTVYVDANNNGVREAGEAGIPNVTITLTASSGGACADGSATCAAATDAFGAYSFTGLPAGTYTLTETQPSGYGDGKESTGSPAGTVSNAAFDATAASNRIAGIPLVAGQNGSGYDFGETTSSSLGGTVYVDTNNDGVPQAGETRLAGVTVTLSGTTTAGANICTIIPGCVTTTAAAGTYSFAGLPAGSYTLTETQPTAYSDGKEGAGVPAGTVNNATFGATAASNRIANIPLAAGQDGSGYNFGEQISAATLSGFVYNDANGNGVKDGSEPGIAGVTLTLTGSDLSGSPVNKTATTDAAGAYSFTNLSSAGTGGYTVVETQPEGWLEGPVAKGVIDGAACSTCNNATLNRISAIPLDALKAFTDFNFGELKVSSISGKVYHDVNKNGTQDAGDPGLGGVTVSLSGNDDLGVAVSRTTTTAADGTYSFTGLRASGAGGYSVTETQPAGIKDFILPDLTAGTATGKINGVANGTAAQNRISAITLGFGQDGVSYDFREDASIFAGGSVYLDANDNGIREAGETGIAKIVVTLTASGGGACADGSATCTATTDAGGYFTFAGLRAGTYTLTETHPVIYTDGKETAGSAGGTVDNGAYDATVAHNRISNIPLALGTQASSYLFGELPGVRARLSGRVWINTARNGTKDQFDPGDTPLPGWIVELVKDGVVLGSTTTGADGTYKVTAVSPDYDYSVRFKNPANGQIWAGPVVNGGVGAVSGDKARIDSVTVPSDGDVTGLDLPIDPSGVVYDAVTRITVAKATVTIAGPAGFDAATHVIGGTASQVTGSDGLYQFLLYASAPSGIYTLSVAPPPDYSPGVSTLIPPCGTSLNVADQPNPAKVQVDATAPAAGVAAHVPASCPTSTGLSFVYGNTSTLYYLSFYISTKTPVSGNVINNHIPVDPILVSGAIVMTKTTPMVNVSRGGMVPYTLTATNSLATPTLNVDVVDQMPPGFKFRSGSARLNGAAVEPLVNGRTLTWRNLSFNANEKKTLSLVLAVGSGVGEGEYVNQTWATNDLTNATISNVAAANVRIVPDPTFDCSEIIGKVFDDRNANGYQDEGEPGIANVRLVTARGWQVTSDKDGRFHVACAAIPQADHGSNFIMKLDERTLPSGFRVTSENPRVVRVTRGKMVKLNFGATVHRVVRVEVSDAAFPSDKLELEPEWQPRFAKLPDDIRDRPSVVRFAYRLNAAPRELAERRLDALENNLRKRWEELACCYPLSIEREITGGAQ